MKAIHLLSFLLLITASSFAQPKMYSEPHRPQFHFSQPAHWMNDPNGMVFYKGEYHLFYQYFPDSTVWGPMHWGHAISKDLVHWSHLPVALYPDSLGLIFSGSVVVDKENTSGFKKGTEDPMVAIFTHHDLKREKAGLDKYQYQGIAYSTDKGRTWKKYASNPVIKNQGDKDFRDPKVFWHQASKHWVMSLAVANKIQFYHSKNLKNWSLTGEFGTNDGSHGGVWECPDLFPIKVEKTNETKWVLIVSIGKGGTNGGSATQYFIGDFDGTSFTNNNPPETILWLDNGTDNYAGVTWNNVAGSRRLFLGWMSNWDYAQQVPTEKWRSAMTIPRELFLTKTEGKIHLVSKPVNELQMLRGKEQNVEMGIAIKLPNALSETLLKVDLSQSTSSDFGIELFNTINEKILIGFDKTNNRFYIDRTKAGKNTFSPIFAARHYAPRISTSKILKMHLFADRASVELFTDDGLVIMTDTFFPNQDFTSLKLYKNEGVLKIIKSTTYPLKSIWGQ